MSNHPPEEFKYGYLNDQNVHQIAQMIRDRLVGKLVAVAVYHPEGHDPDLQLEANLFLYGRDRYHQNPQDKELVRTDINFYEGGTATHIHFSIGGNFYSITSYWKVGEPRKSESRKSEPRYYDDPENKDRSTDAYLSFSADGFKVIIRASSGNLCVWAFLPYAPLPENKENYPDITRLGRY